MGQKKMFTKVSTFVLAGLALVAFAQAKPQTKVDCFTDGFAYGGADILTAGWHNIQASAEDCQTSCQAITDCLFFTYFETGASQGYCELKYSSCRRNTNNIIFSLCNLSMLTIANKFLI